MKANGRVKAIAYAHHFGRWQTQRQMQKPQHSIPCTAHTHDELIIIFTTLWALLVSSGYCWQQYSILCPVCVKISLTESWISKSPTTNESILPALFMWVTLARFNVLWLLPITIIIYSDSHCSLTPWIFSHVQTSFSTCSFSLGHKFATVCTARYIRFSSWRKTLNSFILESVRPSTAPDQSLPNRIWKLYF